VIDGKREDRMPEDIWLVADGTSMQAQAINKYASTKTSAQLLLDLGATIGHIFTTVALWQLTRRDGIWVAVTTLLMITVVLQIVLAVGLLTLRFMGNEDEAIPGRAKLLNNVFFIMCALVAVLEIAIAGAEKFGLDGFVDMVNGTKVCTK